MQQTEEEIAAEESAANKKAEEESKLLEKYSALQLELASLKENLNKQMPQEKKEEEKKEEEKEKPHEHTIKYAEKLKKDMGNLYVKEWDKLKIEDRIKKMETIMEFNSQINSSKKDEQKHTKEAKVPTGNSEKESTKNKYVGQNWKLLNQQILGKK